MASVIKLKKSLTPGSVPSSLQEAEIAVNLEDKKLYIGGKNGGANVHTVSGDQYNLTTVANTSHSTTAATIVLTVDNSALTDDYVSLIGTDSEVDITRNANGSITIGLPTDVTIANDLTVSGELGTGNTSIAGTLDVTGATGIDGDFDINTNKFTVAAATGNMYTAGTLESDGEATLASATIEDLTDNWVVIAGTGGIVEGDDNLTFNGSTLNVGQGNFTATVGSGDVYTAGGLTVDGVSAINGLTATTVTANGAVDLNSTLNVDGSSTLNGLTVTTLTANGNVGVGGDLTVDGNLTVEGQVTYISSSTVNVDDSMIKLSANNAADTVDTGVYGKYVVTGNSAVQYAGYFRDAGDGTFKFYTGLDDEPGTTVNTADTGYSLAQVDAVIDGGTY